MTRAMPTGVAVLGGLIIWLTASGTAEAIPEWARKYKTSCATCHESYPRLTSIGEAFRLNGYRFPANDETYVRIEPTSMGDPAWKKVWPQAIWPSDIPGMPPVSFRVMADFIADIGGEERARTTFEFPHEFEILMGGTLGESFSFFAEVEIEGGAAEVAAFLNWEDLLEGALGENRLNLRMGNVGMQSLDLPGSIDHQRLTRSHYLKNDWRLPYPGTGFSDVNEFRLRDQPGIEVYGFGPRYKYSLGVVNGQGEADDNNSEKDAFFQVAYKIGGLGFDGSGGAEPGEKIPVTPAGGWVDDSVLLGFFAYRGTALIVEDPIPLESRDRFWRLGVDVKGKYGDFGLAGGFIWGNHSDPYGTFSDEDVDTTEWFAEGYWFAYPWLVLSARYESLSIDVPDGLFLNSAGENIGQDVARVVPSVTVLALANIKFILEGRIHIVNERREDLAPSVDKDDDDRIYLRIDWAF